MILSWSKIPTNNHVTVFESVHSLMTTGVFVINTPSLVTGRSISGGQLFILVTGRKFQKISQISKGGTLCKNHFRIGTEPNSGDENFRIVTGSKLAEMLPLNPLRTEWAHVPTHTCCLWDAVTSGLLIRLKCFGMQIISTDFNTPESDVF